MKDMALDPWAYVDCKVNPKSNLFGNIQDSWCVSTCIGVSSKDWPCPAEHCVCNDKPKRAAAPIHLKESCPNDASGCKLKFPYECLDGFQKGECASMLWTYNEHCHVACKHDSSSLKRLHKQSKL